MKLRELFLFSLLALTSCSSFRKMALGTASPLLMDATSELQKEADWNLIKVGMPGNIMLVEGLLGVRPTDSELLVSAIKAHSGAAYGIYETEYLDDKFADRKNSEAKKKALTHYSKAINHGLSFLDVNGVSLDDLTQAIAKDGGVEALLDSELSHNDLNHEGVFYTAHAWGGFINLQRENMTLVAQLPIVKGMFDWVCKKAPDFNYGTCPIFYGSYEAGRPRMLGGNPDKGLEIFREALKRYPHNFMIYSSIIEYYAVPMEEEDVFDEMAGHLEKAQKDLDKYLTRGPGEKLPESFSQEKLRLFQAIALKRYNIIKKYKKEIF
ncbi:MAG: hypothetical protein Fur0010_07580 [Bdellovibrio sp.]